MGKKTARSPATTEAPAPQEPEAPVNGHHPEEDARQRPVFEYRISVVKCAIWANQTDQGIRYNVTHGRLYKRDDTGEWHTAQNYGRDTLPMLIEALRICYLRIFEMQQGDSSVPF